MQHRKRICYKSAGFKPKQRKVSRALRSVKKLQVKKSMINGGIGGYAKRQKLLLETGLCGSKQVLYAAPTNNRPCMTTSAWLQRFCACPLFFTAPPFYHC